MTELIKVTSAPVVDAQRVDVTVPHGASVAEMVAIAMPGLPVSQQRFLRVSLVTARGEMPVASKVWPLVRPRSGTRVVIRLVPGSDTLRSVLMVVVAVAAMAIGQYWVGPALLSAGFSSTAASIGASIASAALTAVGALLLNALIPPTTTKDEEAQNTYQISGWKNRVPARDDAVPFLAGKLRYAPPFAATSYTEIVGDDQYIRALFTFGYGPVLMDDFRLGGTSLADYDEVEIEVREGRETDDPVTLYPRQVLEESVGVELTRPLQRDDAGTLLRDDNGQLLPSIETPVVRHTAAHASSVSLIVAFPAGLFQVHKKGYAYAIKVELRIRQRLVGAVDWVDVSTLEISANKREPFSRQHTWELPSRGRYEIEVTRMTSERTSMQVSDTMTFAGLQSIRPEYPINFSKPVALVALRIKATHQLSGSLDNFNALCQREMPFYAGDEWVDGESSNPASAYLLALKGAHNPYPVTDDQIDLAAIADWHDWCAVKGLKFDYMFDAPMAFGDMLFAICAAGRATPRHDGVQWSVVIDRPDDMVIDHLSPRNSSDFSWQRTYFDPPDAFRVTFQDASNDYEQAERIVPWPGHTGAIDLTESFEIIGKTDPDEIYIEATRRMYELLHRPDSFSAMQSGAAKIATRGDLVMGSYDVISRTQISARVKSVSDYLIELDDEIRMEEGQSYGIRFKSFADETDVIGSSVVREVRTQPGNWETVTITDKSSMPAVGDLVHFGLLDNVSMPLKVKGIEPAEDFASVVHMIAAAPIIDELTDAIVVPAWDGIVGDEVDAAVIIPATPIITSVEHGFDATGSANGLVILLQPGTGSAALLASFEIDHRLSGNSIWTTLTIPIANGGSGIGGYQAENAVEIRVRALATDGTAGAYTSTVSVVIGSDDPVLPSALDSDLITAAGSLGHATIVMTTTDDEATVALQLYRVPTEDTLNRDLHAVGALVAVAPNSSVNMVDGDSTRTTMISNGAFGSVASWSLGDGWAISSGIATHTAGTAGNLEQALSFVSGKYYRMSFALSGTTDGGLNPLISGGSDRAGTSLSANGSYLDRIQAVTGNNLFSLVADADFDGSVDDVILFEESGACVDQGIYDYYIEPQNEDGNPGPISGPFTVTII